MTPAMATEARGASGVWTSRSTEDTERAGAALAAALRIGDVVALLGPLGAGKSRLVAGLARGLGCAGATRSPTFTLVNRYAGALTLFHADLYRVEARDVPGLGLEEMLDQGALAVEWGEKLPPALLGEALAIAIELGSGDERRLSACAAPGTRGAHLLDAWRAAVATDEPA